MLRSSFVLTFLFLCIDLFSIDAFSFELFRPKSRSHIHIVGSSTVYPFTAVIAETFGRDTEFKTPIVESTGTGGGFKLFCSGVGYNFPDFSNASRPIQKSEIKKCAENGVKDISEIKIGYDGIVLANSTSGIKYKLTKKQVFLALADKVPDSDKLITNPYKKWSDIDSSLPKINIAIYGPPTTSGTRDAFVELVMEDVCDSMPEFISVFPDTKIRKKKCQIIRSDGAFIEAGENDNLIVQKLKNDPDAMGIFGFSFLEENHDFIQPVEINKIMPSFDSIVSGTYSVSRPLFIYFKKEHLGLIRGMREFVHEIVSRNTIGNDGYLLQKGLIPLTDLELKKVRDETAGKLN
ncbi:MAG: phosphate ABC transporter substrate-binding protein [Alphaproteobacteria bacterium RIFCSPLOWO2_01_FULL_40_26]|nr:MAG: phosphate ABC transporter substrate-binding protein [Alphaproteobacteria bacterium RIFCSPHIGHO2_02_FULL_40_34]OFW95378.1 MAG: phosphate ABC transporter substrate-binding protein [Alphaproteobacteria bacterium RIFCSPLOWO2_01_FULL_40_26]OFX09274.1 MAG: phosphate ABC transporter substrate-binding protein [Alphaproteobacteria bacterium RIFCSPLOWO2_02_FULL_40_19]OFX10812.1 MAG: phosphate ABC transporter substrate-binding protein [Alphaproteobacteria bacterium RIFCSPLOWO2_12_FULL_40_11]